MQTRLKLYSDGGARGNPGPAAIAYLILSEKDEVITSHSIYVGKRTNNQAEYEAVIAALEVAAEMEGSDIICYLDSELVCSQLMGIYKVKNAELLKLWCKARELIRGFKKVSFVNVPRTNVFIKEADRLVNKTLDEASK